MRALVLGLIVAAQVVLCGVAHAYPQFQLTHDQTCTGCHISPAGGGLLNENGMAMAEATSQWGTAPEFFYGKLGTPSWLQLGGDIRFASGYLQQPEKALVTFPMQADLYANAKLSSFTLHVTVGGRETEWDNEATTHVWSREHYIQWQPTKDATEGLYVRVGRFMPVFGLRFAEHVDYTRRFGGTPLYGETYGAAVEYVVPRWEVHATGFIKDPFLDTVVHDNGGAAYGEYRLTEKLALGGEGMVTASTDDKKFRGGVTAKLLIPSADLLLQAEFQYIDQRIHAGGATNPLVTVASDVGYLLASRPLSNAVLLDVGVGHYDENIRIKNLNRDCADLNLHFFATSHLELIWNNRVEMMAFGSGGPTGVWSLIQVHYRL